MGSFANTVFSILLGWLQGLISMIWSAFTDRNGNSFLLFIGKNWIKIALILCISGLMIDFAVYFFRWEPYKVWRTFWRKLKKRNGESSVIPDEQTAEITEAYPERTESFHVFKDRKPETVQKETEEADDLRRWRMEKEEPEGDDIPAVITKAGYKVSADSPYRRPETREKRRRFRINLLGDSEDEREIHYYSPRPMIDQKEAYHTPVYPEKWTGSREQDS